MSTTSTNTKSGKNRLPGIWVMAVRNISRRPRRSLLSAVAIGIAAMVMVIFMALVNGMKIDMQDNIQRWFTGQVLVEHKLLARGGVNALGLALPLDGGLRDQLAAVPGVASLSPRISSAASSFVDGDAVYFPWIGLDFATDPMQPGRFLQPGGTLPVPGEREALVSTGLARKLGLRTGDVVTAVTQTLRGSTNGMSFRITGVVGANIAQFQGPYLFTSLETAQRFAKMGNTATSLLINADARANPDARTMAAEIRTRLDKEGLTDIAAMPWMETSTIFQYFSLIDLLYGIMSLFFYALASTVIINTMLMVVLERQKEIGTMAALGWEPGKIQRLFLAESAVLSALGAAGGAILGTVISLVLQNTGIDLTDTLQGFTMEVSSVLRPVVSGPEPLTVFIGATLVATAFTILPTRRILGMQVVDALRNEQ